MVSTIISVGTKANGYCISPITLKVFMSYIPSSRLYSNSGLSFYYRGAWNSLLVTVSSNVCSKLTIILLHRYVLTM